MKRIEKAMKILPNYTPQQIWISQCPNSIRTGSGDIVSVVDKDIKCHGNCEECWQEEDGE